MRKLSLIAIGFLISTFFISCNNLEYDTYDHTPIAGWEKNDTLTFNVPGISKTGVYGMDLGLRINGAYPFMGLTLIVEQTYFPDREKKTDTLNCKLIDKQGIHEGQGISYYQYDFHVGDLQLSQGDSIHITVRHDMKREILPGISDIGIQLERKH